MGVSLKAVFGAMLPFALVALMQFYRSTALTAGTGIERKPAAQQQARANRAGPAPFDGQLEPGMRNVSASLRREERSLAATERAALVERASSSSAAAITATCDNTFLDDGSYNRACCGQPRTDCDDCHCGRQACCDGAAKLPTPATPAEQPRPVATGNPVGIEPKPAVDPSAEWPLPTKSAKRLVDGSPNWLPVPNAEGPEPDDLAWRKLVQPTGPCPPGRRPYHTILTAQNSLYQQWQTKIFYYHFRRVQREGPHGGRCTELTGFTRLLAGKADELMDVISTVVVQELGHDKTRGFPVINRPWTLLKWLERSDDFASRVTEDYVYIAETDHLMRYAIPNRATPNLNVAFFFPYMSPRDPKCGGVAQKWLPGLDKDDMPPVGPSPAIMHVTNLKKLVPLWFDLSVKMKADREADGAFGWMLEMWGYSVAALRVGVKHFAWQQLQIEPSAAWHQDINAQDPYIYHYTFGVEYNLDGSPVVGGKGAWSLDKRNYYGQAPPKLLSAPPDCAQQCAWEWRRLFNEATSNLSSLGLSWYERVGGDTQRQKRQPPSVLGGLGKAIVEAGPWLIDGGKPGERIHFFKRGIAWSPWGGGTWRATGDLTVELKLCQTHTLRFDSASEPTSFTYTGGKRSGGSVDPQYAALTRAAQTPSTHPLVARLLGEGPWSFGDAPISGGPSPYAFLRGGVVASPQGPGTYAAVSGSDGLELTLGGEKYTLSVDGIIGCYQFNAVRERDQHKMRGWVMMRHVSMEYTGWRDAWGCTL